AAGAAALAVVQGRLAAGAGSGTGLAVAAVLFTLIGGLGRDVDAIPDGEGDGRRPAPQARVVLGHGADLVQRGSGKRCVGEAVGSVGVDGTDIGSVDLQTDLFDTPARVEGVDVDGDARGHFGKNLPVGRAGDAHLRGLIVGGGVEGVAASRTR